MVDSRRLIIASDVLRGPIELEIHKGNFVVMANDGLFSVRYDVSSPSMRLISTDALDER